MRREAKIFPVLDEPILVMGMPAMPFLFATVLAIFLPTFAGLHKASVVVSLAVYPIALKQLRRWGTRDPQRIEIYLHFRFVERPFFHPVPYAHAPGRRIANRRALLPS